MILCWKVGMYLISCITVQFMLKVDTIELMNNFYLILYAPQS